MRAFISLLAFITCNAVCASEVSGERFRHSATNEISIEISCEKSSAGISITMDMRKEGVLLSSISTSGPMAHSCKEAISFDEDFDGDGVNDVAINDLSMSPNSMHEIFLVSVVDEKIYRAGYLPLAATKEPPRIYSQIKSVGGSIFKTYYAFYNHKINAIKCFEKVVDGDVCSHPAKVLLGVDSCKKKLLKASFSNPICIRHVPGKKISIIVPTYLCNF